MILFSIHYFSLLTDRIFVDQLKDDLNKGFVEIEFAGDVEAILHNLSPAVDLKGSNLILFFVVGNLLHNLHP